MAVAKLNYKAFESAYKKKDGTLTAFCSNYGTTRSTVAYWRRNGSVQDSTMDRLEKYFKARKGAFDASGQKLDWRRLHEVHIAVSAAIEESGADISPERFHYIVSQIYNNYSDVGIDKSLILQQIDIPA